MEFNLRCYNFSPRLRLDKRVDLPEILVGDIILIAESWFSEIGKPYQKKLSYFTKMRVVRRELNPLYMDGPIFNIYLELHE